jgi:hypothetical protein
MRIDVRYFGSPELTKTWWEKALQELMLKASHGLRQPIKYVQAIHGEGIQRGVEASYEIHICGETFILRIVNPLDLPNRKKLQQMLQDFSKPIVLLHENATYQTIKNRVAKCIKQFLDRAKRVKNGRTFHERVSRHGLRNVCAH